MKTQNIKTKRLLMKYSIQKKENLDHGIEELKQEVSAKTQRVSTYRKRRNQYYQNKMSQQTARTSAAF
jgi:prefoldin subunit 5